MTKRNIRPLNKNSLSKIAWRDILQVRRRHIPLSERESAAHHAAERVLNTVVFQQSQNIACYYPLAYEFDCLPLIEKIWQAQKNCYLPVLSRTENSAVHLDFVLYQKDTVLRPNRYRIPEPVSENSIQLNKLDLVLLPLLGFDCQGNRLGMGAGYYDRTFQMCAKTKKPVLWGLAYEVQSVLELPHDSLDVRLNGVVTEKRILYF